MPQWSDGAKVTTSLNCGGKTDDCGLRNLEDYEPMNQYTFKDYLTDIVKDLRNRDVLVWIWFLGLVVELIIWGVLITKIIQGRTK